MRNKVRNVGHYPNVTLTILDTANYGTPLLAKGTAENIEEEADELTHVMASRYQDKTSVRKETASIGMFDYCTRNPFELRTVFRSRNARLSRVALPATHA